MMGHIRNADEMPVWFDMPTRVIVAEKEAKQLKLLITSSDYSRFMVMPTCTADGMKLPPLIIF